MIITTIGWVWMGIVIGEIAGIVVSGILNSGKQADLEAEIHH